MRGRIERGEGSFGEGMNRGERFECMVNNGMGMLVLA